MPICEYICSHNWWVFWQSQPLMEIGCGCKDILCQPSCRVYILMYDGSALGLTLAILIHSVHHYISQTVTLSTPSTYACVVNIQLSSSLTEV